MIDPIDGTYDYINDLDEFTINAGLIIDKKPAAGLICAPAKNRMFFSYGENLAFELIDGKNIKLNNFKNFDKNEIKFVSYSNKIKPEIEKIYKELNVKKWVRMKSSLKFCVIASVAIFGLLVFVFVKNYIKNKINYLVKEEKNNKLK